MTHWEVVAPRAEPGDGFWRYTAAPRVDVEGRWTFTVSVEFPVSDLAYVTEQLRARWRSVARRAATTGNARRAKYLLIGVDKNESTMLQIDE